MRDHVRAPEAGRAKTWVLQGQNSRGWYGEVALRRLVTSRKGRFEWRNPEGNPYILRDEIRRTIESRYADVAFAMSGVFQDSCRVEHSSGCHLNLSFRIQIDGANWFPVTGSS